MNRYLSCVLLVLQLLCAEALHAQNVLTQEDKKRYLEYIEPAEDSLEQAFTILQYVTRGVVKGRNADSLHAVVSMLRQRVHQKQIEYITLHPDRYASLYYFNLNLVNSPSSDVDSLAAIYSRFSKDLKATSLGISVDVTIRKKKALAVNKEMPLFTFKTYTGQEIKLSSFRSHKYVLLCFWDSRCVPCIRNIPLLTKLYNEYNGKGLEMISVSLDKNEQSWFASVKKYEMPWLQTVDLPAYTSSYRLQALYNIQYIPQYFLLDKEGRLIYQDLIFDDSDDHKVLQKLLYDLMK